jgi:hypothetical protein
LVAARGVGWVVGDANAVERSPWGGVSVGFALEDRIGDGTGVATGFEFKLAAGATAVPLLLARLELPAFRAIAELDRSAEFLLTLAAAVGRLPAFEFRFNAAPLLADSGVALRLLTFAFLFDPAPAVDRGVSRPVFAAIEELAPATVNTTSSRLPRCST